MNRLANSTSPYLLQHAHNPVDWYPWGAEALEKAKLENKLILVSIGYSACHWCHVMEHESFEDEAVAAVMNQFFVCIKVDREERPDVDQIYMSAVQLMTGRGGWPLNCICLPDQRPIYGGTYFRKNDWTSLLFNLADFYKQKPEEAEEYAVKLTEGIRQYESVAIVEARAAYSKADIELIVKNWRKYFDQIEGGLGSAPKFPMPNNWQCLMRYAHLMHDDEIGEQVRLTLKKMADGGIYDHIGGGFARYSVDKVWHVPHFEKMLYDNAQLISLYAEGLVWQGDVQYRQVIKETIDFVARELMSPEFGFYSALDADSEGVEGKFYTFSKAELNEILGDDADLFCIYYHVTDEGNWAEEHTNIFFRHGDHEQLAEQLGMSIADLYAKLALSKTKVFYARSQRIRPGLDYKIIASWNGLMLKGLCDAYNATSEQAYLNLALNNAQFISQNLLKQNGKLMRIYQKSPSLPERGWGEAGTAFLDDYANIADAFIALYEVTFDIQWLHQAKKLADVAIKHFYDKQNGVFLFTGDDDEQLIARKAEIMDSVIPSSNSTMARNLYKLGLLFENEEYTEISAQQLRNILPYMGKYGSSYSNWTMLLLEQVFGTYEIAVTGNQAAIMARDFEKSYIPNKLMLGGNVENLPLLQNRVAAESRIFICKDKTCGLPIYTIADALKQIEN